MKQCPYCAEEIQDAAIFCRFCRRDLRLPVSASASTNDTSKKTERKKFDLRSWMAGFVGFFAAEIILLLIRSTFFAKDYSSALDYVSGFYQGIMIAYVVGYLVGGLLAGWLATPTRAKWIGFWLSLVGVWWLFRNYAPDISNVSSEVWVISGLILVASTFGGLLTGGPRQAADV